MRTAEPVLVASAEVTRPPHPSAPNQPVGYPVPSVRRQGTPVCDFGVISSAQRGYSRRNRTVRRLRSAKGCAMEWLAWVVLAAIVAMVVVWLVRRFRKENRRLDGMLRDFDRQNPRREPSLPPQQRRLAGLRRRR